uniref:Uncharacterized protein n=2 Tax=Rhizophora mucronata TaxID=61149 RepID=A0A2P2K6N1_RHIMU
MICSNDLLQLLGRPFIMSWCTIESDPGTELPPFIFQVSAGNIYLLLLGLAGIRYFFGLASWKHCLTDQFCNDFNL